MVALKKLMHRPEQKISVKVWQPLFMRLTEKIKTANLRRDPFLARVLEQEIPELEREICVSNSVEAQKWVASRLENMDRKLVSLALPPQLMSRLTEVCEHRRIVRDAFFNRLFLLLVAPSPDARCV